MKGLIFEPPTTPLRPNAQRNDVVCFIGFSTARPVTPPAVLSDWLREEGWWAEAGVTALRPGTLYDVPLPIHDWAQFDALFDWQARDYGEGVQGAGYLGAAVRSFFAQGGRKCYVVSLGDPLAIDADRAARDAALGQLVPPLGVERSRREQWHGLHHLFGLNEVAFVVLPDLAELCSDYAVPPLGPVEGPAPPVPRFVACSAPQAPPPAERRVLALPAPRCSEPAYAIWQTVLRRALRWIATWRRDLQLLAAIPLPQADVVAAHDLLGFLHTKGWLRGDDETPGSLASPLLQCVYPWLQMRYAGDLPQGLEPGDGVLAGLLARHALTRGSFRNAAGLAVAGVQELTPRLSRADQFAPAASAPSDASPEAPLIDRVSLLGQTASGFRLLSDVTPSNDASRRQASIDRTFALVLRAARAIGEEFVFEPAGEALWGRVEQRLGEVLRALQAAGALAGRRPEEEAYQVRCDRTTMSQQDVDDGRVIAQAWIRPAASIETLRIQLSLAAGQVSLTHLGRAAA